LIWPHPLLSLLVGAASKIVQLRNCCVTRDLVVSTIKLLIKNVVQGTILTSSLIYELENMKYLLKKGN